MIKLLYHILIQIRNFLYDYKILKAYKSSIPVISVGNITTGGTGKTPFVIYITKLFLKENYTPLIISRGYKRKETNQILFNGKNEVSANQVGDEPLLISKKIPEVDIIINKNRVEAIKYAEQSNKRYDIVILDDAFQHRAIQRSLDIVLINTNQNHANLLPHGNLREPLKNLSRADCLVLTKNNTEFNIKQFIKKLDIPVFKCNEEYFMSNTQERLGIGFCGIGDPSSFWKILDNMSINITKKFVFLDHQEYSSSTIQSMEKVLNKGDAFFTTEKDWVKLPENFIKKYTGVFIKMRVSVDDNLFIKMVNKICPPN